MYRIGKYEVLGLLGKGGMGRVYKARLPVAGRIVALKLLAPEELLEVLLGAEEIEKRFLAEAETLGRFCHPYIAQILDFDRDGKGRPFYVMEYFCVHLGMLIGETFESERPTRLLPVDRAVRYARQVISGLERLHAEGVLHRDVKPFNVMLTDEDTVKLIDFGLSTLRGEAQENPDNLKIGTPFYTAPEQESDPASADERADLYSAGVMLWRMLTGHLPAERVSEYRRPGAVCPALGEAFDDFLFRAVHPERGRRFADARSMLVALGDAYADWQREVEGVCRLAEEDPCAAPVVAEAPRSQPVKVPAGRAREVFPVDELWRPLSRCPHAFTDNGDGTVSDPATGLVWQKGGSRYGVDWSQASEYVESLNRERFAGHDGWRLPTVDELMTLLHVPESAGDYCIEPVFDRGMRWLWSADRKSFTAAWFVDVRLGFTFWQDFTCRFHVRAVRMPTKGEKTDG